MSNLGAKVAQFVTDTFLKSYQPDYDILHTAAHSFKRGPLMQESIPRPHPRRQPTMQIGVIVVLHVEFPQQLPDFAASTNRRRQEIPGRYWLLALFWHGEETL